MNRIIIILAIAICLNINAQITIGNFEKKEENKKVEASATKPTVNDSPKKIVYDSLTNIEINHDLYTGAPLDPHVYEKYIGMQFYHPPSVIPGMYSFKNEIMEYANDAKDKYYTLLNVLVWQRIRKDNNPNTPLMNRISKAAPPELQQAFRHAYYGDGSNQGLLVLFQMKDIKTGDTLYCARLHVFILVPYFVKQKSLYEKKILMSDFAFQKEDLITNENVAVKENSRWQCSEVTLLKRSQVYPKNEVTSYYFQPGEKAEDEYSVCYILKNDKNETIALENLKRGEYSVYKNPKYRKDSDPQPVYHFLDDFVTEKYYKEREQQNKLFADQEIAKKKEEEKARIASENAKKAERQKQKAEYIKKYGQAFGEAIADGKVKIGMTKEMCGLAWGLLVRSNNSTDAQGTWEIYITQFGNGKLSFLNGKLIEFKEPY